MDALVQLLPLVVLAGLAYLLFLRPARKRAQQVQALQTALSAGDEIMLNSGIFGRVVSVEDVQVRVEVSSGVVLTVHRGAVEKLIHDQPASDASGSTTSGSAVTTGIDTPPAHPDDPPTSSNSGTI